MKFRQDLTLFYFNFITFTLIDIYIYLIYERPLLQSLIYLF